MKLLYALGVSTALVLSPTLTMAQSQTTEPAKAESSASEIKANENKPAEVQKKTDEAVKTEAKSDTTSALAAPEDYKKWIKMKVYSSDGKTVGKVKDVVTEADGKLKAVHMSTGGYFGMFKTVVLVEAAQVNKTDKKIELTLKKDEVTKLPKVEEKKAETKGDDAGKAKQ